MLTSLLAFDAFSSQLCCSSFFSGTAASSEDEEEDEVKDSYESILDECSIFMRQRSLKWHYRSRDESLITFSNHHFYDNKLVTFPNAVKDHNHGVHFHFVADGVYDRGGRRNNIREAQEVVNLILNHVRSTPDQTLGVIGFSSAQTEAIQNQMERLRPDHPELDQFCDENTPNFFLKPLERVQGDERDVIILSVGYGKDQHGRLYYNFVPINQSSRRVGERRLNVAVTRAKYKLILVSSIQDFDLDLSQTNNKGVERLKDYLAYAANGIASN